MKALCCGLSFIGMAWAEDIRLTVHWVELSHERTTALLAGDLEGDALFQRTRELVRVKEAKLVNTMLLQGKPDGRAIAESIVEVIYPTEHEPPDLPRSPEEDARWRKLAEGWWRAFPGLPIVPVDFESRKIGESLDVDWGACRLIAQLSFYPRQTVIATPKSLDGNRHKIGFPNFESLRITGQATPGHWTLAGSLTPKDGEGRPEPDRKILVFTRADVLAN